MHTSNDNFKSRFIDQIDTHHTIRYLATRTEKSQLKPHQLPPENPQAKPG